jgi:hypothetical protein
MFTSACFAKYSGGSGTAEAPYLIATPNDLNTIGLEPNDWDKHFKMTADINLAGYVYNTAVIAPDTNNTWGGFQGTSFTGIFDGNNFMIDALVINPNEPYSSYLGLFGYIDGGQIKNLGLNKCFVKGDYDFGILTGYNNGTVANCFTHGEILGSNYCFRVGGLIGYNTGSITDCYSTVDVNAGVDCGSIGSLVGSNMGGVIDNCYATGQIKAGPASGGLGCLAGSNSGNIKSCFAAGSVSGHYYLGGLVGENDGTITDCYSICDVSGDIYSWLIGGLVGQNDTNGNLSNCYSTGSVDGGDYSRWIGGLCGRNWEGAISNCYSTGSVTGDNNTGGLVGSSRGRVYTSFWDTETSGIGWSSGGEGKTTAEMQMESTFTDAGWDVVNVWDIGENQTYPFLRTHLPSDINKDDETNFFDLAILTDNWLGEK